MVTPFFNGDDAFRIYEVTKFVNVVVFENKVLYI